MLGDPSGCLPQGGPVCPRPCGPCWEGPCGRSPGCRWRRLRADGINHVEQRHQTRAWQILRFPCKHQRQIGIISWAEN